MARVKTRNKVRFAWWGAEELGLPEETLSFPSIGIAQTAAKLRRWVSCDAAAGSNDRPPPLRQGRVGIRRRCRRHGIAHLDPAGGQAGGQEGQVDRRVQIGPRNCRDDVGVALRDDELARPLVLPVLVSQLIENWAKRILRHLA